MSLGLQEDYLLLRDCARCCYKHMCHHGDDSARIIDGLSCRSSPVDSCFCREDLQPVAISMISTCVVSYCGKVSRDVTSAIAVYTNYCKNTGIKSFSITDAETETPEATPEPTTEPTLEQETPTPTPTPTPSLTGSYTIVATQRSTITATEGVTPTAAPSSASNTNGPASPVVLLGLVTAVCIALSSSSLFIIGHRRLIEASSDGHVDRISERAIDFDQGDITYSSTQLAC